MLGTLGVTATIFVVLSPLLNCVDSTLEFSDYYNFTTDPQCDRDMLAQASTCPFTDSTCQQYLDKSLQCRYNETLERIETLYSYTQSELASINARAESFRINMEKSLEGLASRTTRSTSHVKELFATFATTNGKLAQLRSGEMSSGEQETRQEDLVFLNAFFDDVNETMCEVLSRLESTESTIMALQKSTADNEAQIIYVQMNVTSLEGSVSTLEANLMRAELEIDGVEADLANITEIITTLEVKVQGMGDQVEKNTVDVDELFNATAVIPEILVNLTGIEVRISDLGDRLTASLESLENLNEISASAAQEDIDDLEDNVTELWKKVNYLCDQLNITEDKFAFFGSIFRNLTDTLEDLSVFVLSLEQPVGQEDLHELERNFSSQISALDHIIENLEEDITSILMDNAMTKNQIADLMGANETTLNLLESLSDNVTSVSELYEILEVELDVLNATQEETLASLDQLNETIIACCDAQNRTTPEPLMCCNLTENHNYTELEDRIDDALVKIMDVNSTLIEKISQAGEDCGCSEEISALEEKINYLMRKIPDCPYGFLRIYLDKDQSDFICVRLNETRRTQSEHSKRCLKDGLVLAEFPSAYGFEQFSQYVMDGEGPEIFYYVGASDEDSEGNWIWLNSGVNVNDSYWQSGEPNGGEIGNCAALLTTSGRLLDLNCQDQAAAACMITLN